MLGPGPPPCQQHFQEQFLYVGQAVQSVAWYKKVGNECKKTRVALYTAGGQQPTSNIHSMPGQPTSSYNP